MNTPWRTVPLSSTFGQEVRNTVAADAYTNLLTQVKSKRTVILKDAQALFAANQNLQKRIASEEIQANLKSSLSKSIPEFSLSSSTISNYPASKGSSGSSNASRREREEATVRAAALRNLGQIDLAEQLALQAKCVPTPAAPMAATLLAQCLFLKGRTSDARGELEAVIRITKGSPFEEPYVLKAMIEAAEDRFNVALGDARRATQVDERSTYALLVRSLIESTTSSKPEQLKTALKHARSAADKNAQDWMCMQALMFVESKAGDFEAAQRAGHKAINRTSGKRRVSIEEKVAQCEQHEVPAFDWTTYIESTLSASGIRD